MDETGHALKQRFDQGTKYYGWLADPVRLRSLFSACPDEILLLMSLKRSEPGRPRSPFGDPVLSALCRALRLVEASKPGKIVRTELRMTSAENQ